MIPALVLAIGLGGCGAGSAVGAAPEPTAASVPPTSTTPTASTAASTLAPAETTTVPTVPTDVVEDPSRIAIPAIGVDAPVVDLVVLPDGSLQPPEQWGDAGWWSDGVAPGRVGPAVIGGHLDSYQGPAVFARLGELRPGDRIEVAGADGRTVAFTVDSTVQAPKDDFPTSLVYGPTPAPTLRLVTCGGTFDRSSRHYQDNVIVLASVAT